MTNATKGRDLPWLIIAQIGEPVRETGSFIELNTIVIAERSTRAEAERERDRRNASKDGRWYFVIRANERARPR